MMKKFILLTTTSLIISAFVPSVARSQSPPSDAPVVAPNEVVTPSSAPTAPTNNTAPGMGSNAMTSSGSCSAMSSVTSNTSANPSTPNSSAPMMTKAQTSSDAANMRNNSVAYLLKASSSEVEYNNLIGPAHYIELSVGSSPLCYLSIKPLQDVDANDSIKVLDESGNIINAAITKQDDGGAKISFNEPVSAGSILKVALYGVEYSSPLTPAMVQYSVSGGVAGYSQEIPYGIAQVPRFQR
jgi:hypothetical protein